jgi:medium-chain acyl-[acyl-carrier-protein] hydrolase
MSNNNSNANRNSNAKWFLYPAPLPRAKVRLFCFPYAGGGASMFRAWLKTLPPFIELCTVQLPGRESRIGEPPYVKLATMVEAISEVIEPHLTKPFAFFGHSMGAMISLDLARALRRKYEVEPAHMFVSGRRAPQMPRTRPTTYDLPEPEFIEELRRLNGTPREVLENPELMQLMSPLLRADFSVCQTYEYVAEPPLSCPITVFGGLEDETTRDDLEGWREQTSAACTVRMSPGNHFFIHTAQPQIIRIIEQQLRAFD